jgi:hypothetical protein
MRKGNWEDALLVIWGIAIEHFLHIVPRMFGEQRSFVELWIGANPIRLHRDMDPGWEECREILINTGLK